MLISSKFACVNGNIGSIYDTKFSGTVDHLAECFLQNISTCQKINKAIEGCFAWSLIEILKAKAPFE